MYNARNKRKLREHMKELKALRNARTINDVSLEDIERMIPKEDEEYLGNANALTQHDDYRVRGLAQSSLARWAEDDDAQARKFLALAYHQILRAN